MKRMKPLPSVALVEVFQETPRFRWRECSKCKMQVLREPMYGIREYCAGNWGDGFWYVLWYCRDCAPDPDAVRKWRGYATSDEFATILRERR